MLEPDDLPLWFVARRSMLADTPQAYTADVDHDAGLDEPMTRARLLDGSLGIAAAIEAGRIVAAAGIGREQRYKLAHRAQLWGVWVDPAWRGRGLGYAAVSRAIEHARTWAGVESVRLSVVESQASARRLYERLGFVAWGIEPDALRIAGRAYDDVHMYRRLEPAQA